MYVHRLTVGPFEMNCYIVYDESNSECLLIDPGDEPDRIIDTIRDMNLVPKRIISTHAHIDHIRFLSDIQKHYDIPYYLFEGDLPLLESLNDQGILFGLKTSSAPEVNGFLKEEQNIELGQQSFRIIHTPGHSPGSISLYGSGSLFCGDVLFKDSIGRTDLYGGNYDLLLKSIKEKLLTLPDNTIVYPGHGDTTTIEREKNHNMFLNNDRNYFI
ncbi:MAG: MBL fold metallo-hydrolase [Caldithrix sp.]|nr:MBL fold metallo-hydrolase [Caldithrix sp.]